MTDHRTGADDFDATRTTTAMPTAVTHPSSLSQGWLSSSGSIDHGRFSPGAVLEGRYRIVGLLGRGGMGEVYRADDLRLGQQVAIKFLPPSIGGDTHRLAQFHNEVRMARQVSHPNVCRVHDIGELSTSAGSQLFITMEYVDGEDLAASLKRVGRFPEDKALDIARQVSAGLAAAHSRNVIHRDLKPANIMLDREGQVRLMDFGLAAAGTADDIRAGTPAYMAPEQLLGKEVSQKSDIFALGLVLYELFTGKRVFTAKTIAELVSQQEAGVTTLPSEIVKGLNGAIENVIVWCLDRDPSRRPPSALAVSAALPGSDPLAAALAAGETPSPAMVAAAGQSAPALTPVVAGSIMAVCALMLIVCAWLADRIILPARVPLDRASASLFDRARDLERALGYGGGVVDRASGFTNATNVTAWLRANRPNDADKLLATGTPPAMLFWYRSGTDPLIPRGKQISFDDPTISDPGMTSMTFDTTGRLYRLTHVSDSREGEAAPTDWPGFLTLAGFDPARFTETAPQWVPTVYADTRKAWSGTIAELPDVNVQVEAGSARGHVVYSRVFSPWLPQPVSGTGIPGERQQGATAVIASLATLIIAPGIMLLGALIARNNLKKGRGDRIGASRLAFASVLFAMISWAFGAHHPAVAEVELNRFFSAMGSALFEAAIVWLFYLAAEPQVRRVWPHILITWSRINSTGGRDPLVGRDLLIGAAAGVFMTLASYVFFLMPHVFGLQPFEPRVPALMPIAETRFVMAQLMQRLTDALQNAMLGVLGLAMLRMVLRKQWLVFLVAVSLFTPLAARGQFQSGITLIDLLFGAMLVAAVLGVCIRFGLFAGFVTFAVHFWTFGMPITLSTSHQYFEMSLFVLGLVIACAAIGVILSRGSVQGRDLSLTRAA